MFGIDPDATRHVDTGAIRWHVGMIPLDVLEELEAEAQRTEDERREAAISWREDRAAATGAVFARACAAYESVGRQICRWGLRGVELVPDKAAPPFLSALTPWDKHCEAQSHAGKTFRLLAVDAVELLGRIQAKRPIPTPEGGEQQYEKLPLSRWLAVEIMAAQRLSGDELLGF